MLVLTRKIGEEIVIAGNIRISIVEVGPGRVKIGIVAPRSVSVDRAEVHEKKQSGAVEEPIEAPSIHNRIAETLLGQRGFRVIPADTSTPAQLENRLKKHQPRLPRKPR